MKKQIYSLITPTRPTKLDDVPDISNRYVDLDVVLSWLDTLEEVNDYETNISDN